ncbi:MAG: hypothetical protein JOY92_13270 [Verrucomicrobia bacterium]|nr:hypothetical protein [Verrucomicrobiota bacterium]
MSYAYKMENGRQLLVDNEGDQTRVSLGQGQGGSQQQSQGNTFDTGSWSKAPTLLRAGQDLILKVETKNGPRYIRVRGDDTQLLNHEPDLGQAEQLDLSESDQPAGMKPMEPMKPMKPMS